MSSIGQDTYEKIAREVLAGDGRLARAIAKVAIEQMFEASTDLWTDLPDRAKTDTSIPTKESIRSMAIDYAADMVGDFVSKVSRALESAKINLQLKRMIELHGSIAVENA